MPPIQWLSVTSLDAPIVALAWQYLFASAGHFHVPVQSQIALFTTAWAIYLTDRYVDSFTIPTGASISSRQRFSLQHRNWFRAGIGISLLAITCVLPWLDRATLLAGFVVGCAAVGYLLVNHLFGKIWRTLPIKELAIGTLFAAGVLITVSPLHWPGPQFAIDAVLFACLCALNCISIAKWECDLDREQQRDSIATAFPRSARVVTRVCIALALAAACYYTDPVAISVGVAAAFLTLLNLNVGWFSRDSRTALADIALLAPLMALPFLG